MNESEIRRQLCEILGVGAQASEEEIKKAYTAEAKKWHPDRVQHNSEMAAMAEKKLKEINQAYECLTDRVQFDKYAFKLAQKHSDATATAQERSGASAKNNANASASSGSNSSAHNNSTGGATTYSSTDPAPASQDKGGIVKIFLATGLFVIIVILVANLTAPRHESPANPGVRPSPADSPGAPFSGPSTFSPQPTTVPPDSSIAPPPGSN